MDMALTLAEAAANPDEQIVDGIPESFIGPLLADLVAHEAGHGD
jgi:hypothetical protein